MKGKVSILIFLFILALSFLSVASELKSSDDQSKLDDEKSYDGALVGIAMVYSQQPYCGVDDKLIVIPSISLEYEGFFLKGTSLGYYFSPKDNPLRFAVVSSLNFAGYDAEDSDSLKGMDDRDWGIDGGIKIEWKNDYFNLNLDLLSDISSRSDGQQAKLSVSKKIFKYVLVPRFGLVWQSSERVDYYYGVKDNESTLQRAPYSPDSEFEYFCGLRSGFPLTENIHLMADVQANFLGKEVKNSPIVDKSYLLKYMIGLSYRF